MSFSTISVNQTAEQDVTRHRGSNLSITNTIIYKISTVRLKLKSFKYQQHCCNVFLRNVFQQNTGHFPDKGLGINMILECSIELRTDSFNMFLDAFDLCGSLSFYLCKPQAFTICLSRHPGLSTPYQLERRIMVQKSSLFEIDKGRETVFPIKHSGLI